MRFLTTLAVLPKPHDPRWRSLIQSITLKMLRWALESPAGTKAWS